MVSKEVKARPGKRRYDATRPQAAALETRRAITGAARELFLERGYIATTIAAIAAAAGVSHQTVYATLGPKPAVLRHLIETALSGVDEPIPRSSATTPAKSSPSKTRAGWSTSTRTQFA